MYVAINAPVAFNIRSVCTVSISKTMRRESSTLRDIVHNVYLSRTSFRGYTNYKKNSLLQCSYHVCDHTLGSIFAVHSFTKIFTKNFLQYIAICYEKNIVGLFKKVKILSRVDVSTRLIPHCHLQNSITEPHIHQRFITRIRK